MVLLSKFLEKNEIFHEEITSLTWGHPYEERHFQKIWTSIQRVNEFLKNYIGMQKIFRVSKNSVALNEKIKIIDLKGNA